MRWDARSTDSPLHTDTGDLEALPAFADQLAGAIRDIPPAGWVIKDMVWKAQAILARLRSD
jgi:predicted ester cyclase